LNVNRTSPNVLDQPPSVSPNQLVRSPTRHREANTCKATGKRAERTPAWPDVGKAEKSARFDWFYHAAVPVPFAVVVNGRAGAARWEPVLDGAREGPKDARRRRLPWTGARWRDGTRCKRVLSAPWRRPERSRHGLMVDSFRSVLGCAALHATNRHRR
jgi:hypothetical protein